MISMINIKKHLKENRGFIIFIVLMCMFRSAVADYNSVPTGSMLPTIIPGDQIGIDKLAYDVNVPFINYSVVRLNDPKRGEIVVFESQAAQMRLVKRVIGVPGDVIELVNNELIINGEAIKYSERSASSSIYQEQLPTKNHAIQIEGASDLTTFGPVEVPQGSLLVLGDNRNNSSDSRVYGFIPRDEVIGQATRVVMSFNYDEHYKPRGDRFWKPLI